VPASARGALAAQTHAVARNAPTQPAVPRQPPAVGDPSQQLSDGEHADAF